MAELNEFTINGSNYTFEDDVARGLATTETSRAQAIEQSLQTAINGKVDKVAGKGLSTNDYTDAEKAKLAELENYDDTQVRQLITQTNANFANYYTKAESYSATEVDTLLRTQRQGQFVVVSTLPAPSADTMFKIYLIPSTNPETQNVKDEFVTLENNGTYSWEQIGTTAVDLSGYSTTEEMNAVIASALASYYTKSEVDEALGGKQNTIDDLANIRSGASAGATAVQPSTLNSALSDTVAESGVYDVTANNNNAKFASLSALLGSENLDTLIPSAKRKGGMSIKFVQSSDNKYVQYFLTKNEWSVSETDWEKMNLEEDVDQLSQKLDFILSTEHTGYLISDGTYSTSSEYHSLTTDRIKCVPGDKFMYRGVGRSNAISALFYSNNVIISSLQVNSPTQFSEIVIPDGIDEVCFSSFNSVGNEIILNVYHESQVISEINEDISEITSGIYGTILSNVKVSKQELSFIPVNINKGDYFQVKINVSGITRFVINYNENNNNRLFDTRDMSKVGVWLNFYAPTNLTYIGYWLDVSKGTTLSVRVGGTITELRGEVLSSDTKVLHGKIGVSFGDSIMRGNGNNNRGPLDLLISDYQCDGTNYAVGGATCAENSGRSHIVAQIQEAIAAQISPDFILLNGGSNDILYSQFGTLTDSYDYVTKGYATYTDGLEYCFGLLKDTFPSVPILFMLPHSTPSRNYTTEQQFWGRAREICKKWSIPIADIEQDGNLNTRISTQLTAFADEGGTHPNGAGYQYAYIPLIVTKLKQIFGYRITQ